MTSRVTCPQCHESTNWLDCEQESKGRNCVCGRCVSIFNVETGKILAEGTFGSMARKQSYIFQKFVEGW